MDPYRNGYYIDTPEFDTDYLMIPSNQSTARALSSARMNSHFVHSPSHNSGMFLDPNYEYDYNPRGSGKRKSNRPSLRDDADDDFFEDKRVEKLKKKVKELENELKEAVEKLRKEKERSKTLKVAVENLEESKKKFEGELKDKQKIEEQAKEKLTLLQSIKQQLEGIDTQTRRQSIFGDGMALHHLQVKNSSSAFVRFWKSLFKYLAKVFIFKRNHLTKIGIYYDSVVEQYFTFLFLMLNANWLSLIPLLYVIVVQIIDITKMESTDGSYYILLMSYTYTSSDNKLGYSVSILAVTAILIIIFFYRYAHAQTAIQRGMYKKTYHLTHLVFSEWNWSHRFDRNYIEKRTAFLAKSKVEIETYMYEREEEEEQPGEKFVKQVVSLCLFLAILVGQWFIGVFLLSEKGVAKYLDKIGIVFVPEFLMGLIIALVSLITSYLAYLTPLLQNWKDKKTANIRRLWRFFLSKILFTGFVAIISFFTIQENAVDSSVIRSLLIKNYPLYNSSLYDCPGDHFIFKIFGFIAGELILSILTTLTLWLISYIKAKKSETIHKRPPFNVEQKLAVGCSLQLYIWILFPYLPIMAVIGTILFALLFQLEYIFVKWLMAPPAIIVTVVDLKNFVKQAYSLALFFYLLFFIYTFGYAGEHGLRPGGAICGPYDAGEQMDQPIWNELDKNSVSEFIADLVVYVPLLWILIIFLAYQWFITYTGKTVIKALYDEISLRHTSQKKRLAHKVQHMNNEFKKTKRALSLKLKEEESSPVKLPVKNNLMRKR